MDALLTTIDTLLVAPLQPAELCRQFYTLTGTSLTKACGQRPCDFLARYPSRYTVGEAIRRVAPPTTTRGDLKPWLAAAGRAAPPAWPLPEAFAQCLQSSLCLRPTRVEVAGSAGRGTCSAASADAAVLLLFDGMVGPWMGPMLAMLPALLSTLQFAFEGRSVPVTVLRSTNTFVECSVDGILMPVSVEQARGSPEEQLTAFVRRQPTTTLHALRLVKEWAAQEPWSAPYLTPSPLLLELVTIHTATQHPGLALPDLVAHVHERLRNAEDLDVTWGTPAQASPAVLHPFSGANLASTAVFDPTELVACAHAVQDVDAAYAGGEPETDAASTASFVSATSTTTESASTTSSPSSDATDSD